MLTKTKNPNELRKTGIEVISETSWGTHFCNFYETEQDMLDILVPFFKTGLENNEYCVYITTDSLSIKEAEDSLRMGIVGLDQYLEEKRIEIITHKDWYLRNNSFDAKDVFMRWDEKLEHALSAGFEGLRINGNAAWLERNIWDTFIEYESALNEHINGKKIIVMCTYPLHKCTAADVLDVAHVHKSAIAKRRGEWEIFETPDTKRTKANILKSNEQLRDRLILGTKQLKKANLDLEYITQEQTITEEALQRSESNLFSIFENTGTALILLDIDLNVMLTNNIADKQALTTFGNEYKYGENILDMLKPERKELFATNCNSVLKGSHIVYETNFPLADGSLSWHHTRMFPIQNENNKSIGICISSEDITARKNEEIEKEKITNDLIYRNRDLEQFSYMVSHNLRAPVANIMGFSKMLTNNLHSEEEKETFSKHINSSANILDEVIRDLNLILKVKTEIILKTETVNFSIITQNIIKTIQSSIEKEKAVINTDFSNAESIIANRVYLYSIFHNLISNGIKYHRPGHTPVINISTSSAKGKTFIVFKDNGLGIDLVKNNDKVFGLYKRFHPEIKGKGMGLFMVKSQVDILGGRISIDSQVNIGTTFTIELN